VLSLLYDGEIKMCERTETG